MTLSDGQATALRNLARKRAGHDVDWISIAEARALTEMGLASRTREGWEITTAGLEALGTLDPEALRDVDQPAVFRPGGSI